MTKTELNSLSDMLNKLDEFCSSVEELHDKYEDVYDGHSERWQESEKGEELYEMVENLDCIMQSLGEAKDYLEEVLDNV